MKNLSAMEYEMDVLKIKTLVEALKIYSFMEPNQIPEEFKEIYLLGEKIHILMNEMENITP